VSDIQIGFVVSGVGLTITFLALAVFIGVIVILQKLFPVKLENEDIESETAIQVEEISTNNDEISEMLVAALAAAAYMRYKGSGQLGASLLTGPGPYWTSR
jgi:Na+-transporting methylmalonyl-CoA/oxaloacetate decarboxylase gamma subunit